MGERESYRSILKANTLFGGVQIYNIIISIIRSKIVAVVLGTYGMGVMGLLNSTISLIQSATNFGIGTSAVRDVALAKGNNNVERLAEVRTVLIKIVYITGLLGLLFTFAFAPFISEMTFGNKEYTSSFRWLSIVLFFLQLSVGNMAFLQGVRALKSIAIINVLGNTISLVLCVPLYFIWGLKAIVPAIIIPAILNYIISKYYYTKIVIKPTRISLRETWVKGKGMLLMGFLISLTGLMDTMIAYIVRIVISQWGSLSEVGLYNAGYAMIVGYVGLVFSSISTDYYPRLSSVSENKQDQNTVICQQADIMLFVLCPIIVFFIAFGEKLIIILYSKDFLPVVEMVNLIAFGMMFRALNWCPGFLYLAKNDSKLYFCIYVLTTALSLVVNVLLFKCMGLVGLGWAFLLLNVLSFFGTIILTKWRYGFVYERKTIGIAVIQVILCFLALFISYMDSPIRYLIFALLILFSIIYSYRGLNKRVGISLLFISLRQKFLRKK